VLNRRRVVRRLAAVVSRAHVAARMRLVLLAVVIDLVGLRARLGVPGLRALAAQVEDFFLPVVDGALGDAVALAFIVFEITFLNRLVNVLRVGQEVGLQTLAGGDARWM